MNLRKVFFERNDFIIISLMIRLFKSSKENKDEHVQRFELSAIRGKLLREKERERKREREREQQIINKIEINTYLFVK